MVNHCISVIFSPVRLKIHLFHSWKSNLYISFITRTSNAGIQAWNRLDLVSVKRIGKFSLCFGPLDETFLNLLFQLSLVILPKYYNFVYQQYKNLQTFGFHKCTYIQDWNRFIKTANFRLSRLFVPRYKQQIKFQSIYFLGLKKLQMDDPKFLQRLE